MNLTIRNIKLKELDEYLESKEYHNSTFIPISKIRALSHINNPRAEENDICLFLAYRNDKLIGYLGAIADSLFVSEIPEKVFWLSCMWVLPEYRRDGIALKLLLKAYEVFKGKVLITNFIPRSKGAFDRTEQYFDLHELDGIRGYSLFDLKTLIIRRYPKLLYVKSFLAIADYLVNYILKFRQARRKNNLTLSCEFSEITDFDKDISSFIEKKSKQSLFRRNASEFAWIKQYPWIKKTKEQTLGVEKYYFSQESRDFEQLFVKVQHNNTLVGFLILTIFKGEIKIPYMYYEPEFASDIAKYIAQLIIKKGVKTYIGYDKLINNKLLELGIFYHKRNSNYGFIAGKELEGIVKNKDVKLFYGDGDGAFT